MTYGELEEILKEAGRKTMSIEAYTAIIDTAILLLLLGWSIMDRCNIYLLDK